MNSAEIIDKILPLYLTPKEEYLHGYADLTGLVENDFGEFKYGICIGKKLDDRIVGSIAGGPTPEYFTHYRTMNTDLAELTKSMARDLNLSGIETLQIEPSVTTDQLDTIYEKTLRTSLSHKMVATRAGLGWIGKTDLFISKKFGPRLRLVTILTKTPLKSATKPIDKSRCGTCTLCVEVCPAKAANGKLWNTTIDRDEFFDAFKCRKQCAEFGRTHLHMDARVCGICVAVCPVGQEVTSDQ